MSRAAALSRPLASLKGVGDRRAADLASAGLQTVEDLLVRFPLRYEDRGHPRPLAEIAPGRIASAIGTIVSATIKRTRRPGFSVFEVVLRDRSGTARAVWFNQRFLKDVLRAGQTVALFGKVEQGAGGLQFASPQYEILADEPLAGGWLGAADADADADPEAAEESGAPPAPVEEHLGIVPIYERIGTLTPKIQRGLVAQALATLPADLPDALPDAVRRRLDLPSRRDALVAVHQPPPGADVDALNRARSPGHMRLIFEEFFAFQTGVLLRRRARLAERKPHAYRVDDALREKTRALLPFPLTAGQKIAVRDIVADLQKPEPMNRLLQGDVGSGKTLVATLAALVALESGLQVAIMAPTEILAEQHARTLSRFFATTRYAVALLTGRTGGAERRERLANIANGTIHARRRHARAGAGDGAVRAPRPGDRRRAASLRRRPARRSPQEGRDAGRAGDDRDADPAHAGADHLRRARRDGDARSPARPIADRHDGAARVAPRRRVDVRARRAERRTPGLRDLSAGRGEREDRRARRDRDGRSPVADGVPGVAGRPAARPARRRTRSSA